MMTNRDKKEGDPDVKAKRKVPMGKVPGEVPAIGWMPHEAAAFEKSREEVSRRTEGFARAPEKDRGGQAVVQEVA